MMSFDDFVVLVQAQIAGWDARTWLAVAAVIAAFVVGIMLRLARFRATQRLRAVLDIYAERQMALNVRLDPASSRQNLLSLDASRKSGLVMGVRR
jgi:hypothetical protein